MATIQQSIEVNIPLHAVYSQWTQFKEFPRFMEGVREVRQLDDSHLHWLAERDGRPVEWDSEITEHVPGKRIAWRDISGPHNSGCVYFESVQPGKTRVLMTMDVHAHALEKDSGGTMALNRRVEQDLIRFKQMVEKFGAPGSAGTGRSENPGGSSNSASFSASSYGPAISSAPHAAGESIGKPVGQTEEERRNAGQSSVFGQADYAGMGMGSEAAAASVQQQYRSGMKDAPRAEEEQASAQGMHANSSHKSAGAQSWIPNFLHGWEEPMTMVRKMGEEMDQLFERFIGRPMAIRMGQGSMPGKWMPPVEISQRDNQLIICADLPGVKKEDVQIEVTHNKLIIEGERREENVRMSAQSYRRSERSYGQFYRMIPLPEGVDPDSAHAALKDGVLEIAISAPSAGVRRGRRLDIDTPH